MCNLQTWSVTHSTYVCGWPHKNTNVNKYNHHIHVFFSHKTRCYSDWLGRKTEWNRCKEVCLTTTFVRRSFRTDRRPDRHRQNMKHAPRLCTYIYISTSTGKICVNICIFVRCTAGIVIKIVAVIVFTRKNWNTHTHADIVWPLCELLSRFEFDMRMGIFMAAKPKFDRFFWGREWRWSFAKDLSRYIR